MAGKTRYKVEDFIQPLRKANGMRTIAAKLIGCDYKTLVSWVKKSPTLQDLEAELRGGLGDQIESTLLAVALGQQSDDKKSWTIEPNVTALIFLAKTHPAMRDRGYVERHEHTGKDGEPIVKHEHHINYSQLDEDTLRKLAGQHTGTGTSGTGEA